MSNGARGWSKPKKITAGIVGGVVAVFVVAGVTGPSKEERAAQDAANSAAAAVSTIVASSTSTPTSTSIEVPATSISSVATSTSVPAPIEAAPTPAVERPPFVEAPPPEPVPAPVVEEPQIVEAPSPAPEPEPAAPDTSDCNIKGNISTKTDEKIYHVPGQRFYDETEIDPLEGERMFCSAAEAEAAGWRASKV